MPNSLENSIHIGKILGLAEATKDTLKRYKLDGYFKDSLTENMDEIIQTTNKIKLYED